MWDSHNKAYVVIYCNDPKSLSQIKELDADEVIEGTNLPSNTKPRLRRRQVDCWQKGNKAASLKADYVIHYHADAHALKIQPIINIINEMEQFGYFFAGRGRGLDFKSPVKSTHGDIDDHFFISKANIVSKSGLWDIEPGKMLHTINSESFLAYSLQKTFDNKKIYHYSNMSENIVDEETVPVDMFYKDSICHRHMHPYNYDPIRHFLHTNDWSKKAQFMQEVYGNQFSKIKHFWKDLETR